MNDVPLPHEDDDSSISLAHMMAHDYAAIEDRAARCIRADSISRFRH
jgi:hypothetical protein